MAEFSELKLNLTLARVYQDKSFRGLAIDERMHCSHHYHLRDQHHSHLGIPLARGRHLVGVSQAQGGSVK